MDQFSKGRSKKLIITRGLSSMRRAVVHGMLYITHVSILTIMLRLRCDRARHQQREGTEEMETHFGRILESSLNEIYIFDSETLRFIQVNRGARQNLGYTMDELKNLTPLDLKPEFTAEIFAELIQPLRKRKKEIIKFMTDHRRKDGSVYPVEVHLQLFSGKSSVVFAAIVLDITEQKKAEEEIKRYRNHLKDEVKKRTKELNFQKYALDEHAIVSATDADGNIIYANDKFCEISNYTLAELIGKNHRMLKSKEHPPELFRDMWLTIINGKPWVGEIKNKKKNSGYYWVKATIVPFMDERGKPHQYISIRTDITDVKNSEKEINKYASKMEKLAEERSRQLIHADRMITLGTLAAGVAHEINNPVGFVSSNLQIFEKLWNQTIRASLEKANRENEDKKLTFALDEMPKMVKSMKEGTTRIINIVRGLSKFSRKTKHVFEASDICEIIEAAVKFCGLDLAVKHKVNIQLDLPNDIPSIKISRQEIEQVLINLITNSGHAMEGITDRKELILKIVASHVNDNVVMEVADNGYGMDEENLDNIFNPFFTTKDVGKGTGLGLSICRGIIEQHRGNITATSTLGEGTTFTITLPIDPQKRERRKKDEKIIDGMRAEDR